MPGDTEIDEIIENTEPKVQEQVLSHTEDPKNEPETEKVEPVREDSETKRRNFENMTRRLQMKNWKQKLHDINSDPEISNEAAKSAALKRGFNIEDKNNKGQVELIGDAIHQERIIREGESKKIKREASTEILSDTLKEIGYDPKSEAFRYAGELLFKKFGTDNPDVFLDTGAMKTEIKNLSSMIAPREKEESVVERNVIKKASIPLPSKESRSAPSGTSDEVKRVMESMGLSKERAERMIEINKKLPAHLRKK